MVALNRQTNELLLSSSRLPKFPKLKTLVGNENITLGREDFMMLCCGAIVTYTLCFFKRKGFTNMLKQSLEKNKFIKGTVMQIKKALIKDCLSVSKVS